MLVVVIALLKETEGALLAEWLSSHPLHVHALELPLPCLLVHLVAQKHQFGLVTKLVLLAEVPDLLHYFLDVGALGLQVDDHNGVPYVAPLLLQLAHGLQDLL